MRRAFLCGEDAVTGKDYSHRKGWILARLALLAEVFTIELFAYAVMSNHYHLVVNINQNKALSLTQHEVISRWSRLFRVPEIIERWRVQVARIETAKATNVWQRKPNNLCGWCPVTHCPDWVDRNG